MHIGGFIVPVTIDLFSLIALALVVLALLIVVRGLVRIARERHVHFFQLSSGLVLLLLGPLVLHAHGRRGTRVRDVAVAVFPCRQLGQRIRSS